MSQVVLTQDSKMITVNCLFTVNVRFITVNIDRTVKLFYAMLAGVMPF